MQMTQIIQTDWLSEIDGLTVEKAIAYLKTLNPADRLQTSLDGDTHGVELTAYLEHDRPATELEIQKYRENLKKKKINDAQRQVDYLQKKYDYYVKVGNTHYMFMYSPMLAEAKAKLQELTNA